jgi:hypothetical protein
MWPIAMSHPMVMGGDGNSAVEKSRSNIPNTVRAAALHKPARGFLAGDNWRN